MSKFEPISFEDFNKALGILNAHVKGHEEFLYSIYSYTVEGIDGLAENQVFGNLQGIVRHPLHLYILGSSTRCEHQQHSHNH